MYTIQKLQIVYWMFQIRQKIKLYFSSSELTVGRVRSFGFWVSINIYIK